MNSVLSVFIQIKFHEHSFIYRNVYLNYNQHGNKNEIVCRFTRTWQLTCICRLIKSYWYWYFSRLKPLYYCHVDNIQSCVRIESVVICHWTVKPNRKTKQEEKKKQVKLTQIRSEANISKSINIFCLMLLSMFLKALTRHCYTNWNRTYTIRAEKKNIFTKIRGIRMEKVSWAIQKSVEQHICDDCKWNWILISWQFDSPDWTEFVLLWSILDVSMDDDVFEAIDVISVGDFISLLTIGRSLCARPNVLSNGSWCSKFVAWVCACKCTVLVDWVLFEVVISDTWHGSCFIYIRRWWDKEKK